MRTRAMSGSRPATTRSCTSQLLKRGGRGSSSTARQILAFFQDLRMVMPCTSPIARSWSLLVSHTSGWASGLATGACPLLLNKGVNVVDVARRDRALDAAPRQNFLWGLLVLGKRLFLRATLATGIYSLGAHTSHAWP